MLDGILFDDRKHIKNLVRIYQDQSNYRNIVTVLEQVITTPNRSDLSYEAAARILSFVLSELDRKDK